MTWLEWFLEHTEDILAIYGSIVAICTIVVKWTKNDTDNKILAKIVKIADYFSTVFTKEDAAKLAAATKKLKK